MKAEQQQGMGGAQQIQNRLHKGIHFFRENTLLEGYFCMTQIFGRTTIFEFASHFKKITIIIFTSLFGTQTGCSHLRMEFRSPTVAKFWAFWL